MVNRTVSPASRSLRPPLRRCSFRFSGQPTSVGEARDWLGRRLNMAAVPEQNRETALLLLSELATNQVLHTPRADQSTGDYFVRAFFFHGWLRVEVRDVERNSPEIPMVSLDLNAEHGRGLLLINALASRWGRFESGRGPGMFFELRWDR
ncbi:ATP-binding protein [Nocardiopsis metallicus]|uniref:Anti-sigma regulatory factor (Ser/Thr protein kinase) n=1 Tax=Nocardiopsis metallicus TaxID=179819 RepID=A0A840WZM0_9ACTN|nr:ATP-binding protein [Nocardiopsis metallicus]MBB5495658.1 anti-sigma regulatory factor (Ser/Thr protein kinase) [Nocardiopsis metallicus]